MLSTSSAIHMSILFACLVIFLPLLLAGVHLSRHKLLFSSAALFFSLFLFIHISPYLPVLFLYSPSDPSPSSCVQFLHHPPSSFSFSCKNSLRTISKSDARDLLNGSYVLIVGDSQSRLFTLSLIDLLIDDGDDSLADQIRSDLFRRHSDYHFELPVFNILVDFLWAPYESNITEVLRLRQQEIRIPDVMVMGSGLWHMLHATNASDYGEKLGDLRDVVEKVGVFRNLFWLGLPKLVYGMLNTEEKRIKMNEAVYESYEKEVKKCGFLRRDGGEFILLDVGYLSGECGRDCTKDGMHYEKVVYDAAVQIMVNALLVESQQRV